LECAVWLIKLNRASGSRSLDFSFLRTRSDLRGAPRGGNRPLVDKGNMVYYEEETRKVSGAPLQVSNKNRSEQAYQISPADFHWLATEVKFVETLQKKRN